MHRTPERRPNSNQRGYTYRWEQYRARYLQKHPLCTMCQAQGRVEAAEVVDHIIPVTGPDDPRFWDTTNHQALSHRCHSIKTRQDVIAGLTRTHTPQARATAHVVVVCGLPATGKTTYVLQRAQRNDLIVDMDRLYSALSGLPLHDTPQGLLPFVASARDAIYTRLQRGADIGTAYIITTDRFEAKRLCDRFNGELIELTIDESVRSERLQIRAQAALAPPDAGTATP